MTTQGKRRDVCARLRVLGAVTGVLMVAAAAGCSPSEPEPEPTLTRAPVTTPTPTPEPTEEQPDEPVAPLPHGTTPDPYDAERAAEFFVELHNYAVATGDVEQWEERTRGCEFCANTAADLRDYVEKGYRQDGGEIIADDAVFTEFASEVALYSFEIPYEVAPSTVVDPDDRVVHEFGAGAGFLVFEIGYEPGAGWNLFRATHHEESLQ